jgi:polygalacturonase
MNRRCSFSLLLCCVLALSGCQSAPAPDVSPAAPAQPVISAPDIPAHSFTITDFGAVGDGKFDNTNAITSAIVTCSAAGGGHVVIPAGNFLTRPIRLQSQIDLHLDAGALLVFSRNRADFPLVLTNYEGQQTYMCASPIMGDNLHDLEISGQGAIDGQGQVWRMVKESKLTPDQWNALVASGGYVDRRSDTWYPVPNARRRGIALAALRASLRTPRIQDFERFHDMLRPPLVVLSNCHNVLLDGVTFQNSAAWNIHLLLTDDVTVHAITIFNPYYAQNGDGIDIDSCRHVLVTDSTINAGDDVICLKSGRNEEGRRMDRPTEDVTVENCVLGHGHGGIAIGSEMSGGVRDIHVHDCILNGTDDAIRIKSTRGRGGIVENIDIHNLEMWNITNACINLDMYYMVKKPPTRPAPPPDFDAPPPPEAPVAKPLTVTQEAPEPLGPGTPLFRNINIRNILCHSANIAIQIHGLPEMPLQSVTIENADITAKQGGAIIDADGATLRNVTIRASAVPDLQFQHATNITLEHVDAVPQALPPMVTLPPATVGLANP